MIQDGRGWPWSPALGLAICFGAGILFETYLRWPLVAWAGGVCLSMVALIMLRMRPERRLVNPLPLLLSIMVALTAIAAGGWRAAMEARPPAGAVDHVVLVIEGREAVIEGRIGSFVVERPAGVRFTLDVQNVHVANELVATTGRLQVFLNAPAPAVEIGTRIRLLAEINQLPIQRNPADFDYGTFLRRQGIGGIVYAEGNQAELLDARTPLRHRPVAGARRAIGSVIAGHVPSEEGRLVLRALLLGDRSGLSSEDRERLARSGLMHLLAVSGLHVLLVGMVLYQLLRPMLLRVGVTWRAAEWTRSIITISILIFYMMLTGGSPSVVRAVTMASLFIGATLAQRPVQSMNTLGASGIVILLLDPDQLVSAGFQLSFSAVGAILLFGRHLRLIDDVLRSRSRVLGFLAGSVLVSLAATLGTLPALLFHFGRASFAGLILNVAAIPATFGVLASGLLLVVTSTVSQFVANCFGSAADVLAIVVLTLARIGESWSNVALLEQRIVDGWWIGAIAAATFALALIHHRRFRWRSVMIALACITIAVWSNRSDSRSMDILFFDVGQGDAVLVRLPGGRVMLVDAGPRTLTFDAGERVIEPNLRHLGIRHIDAVVISHPHSDHLGGLPHLLRSMSVGAVYHNGHEHESRLFDELTHLLDSLSIEHRTLTAGDVLDLDAAVHVKVLAPVPTATASVNDASIVLRLTHNAVSILLTGDAEAPSESVLSAFYEPLLPATLIKAGHHGSSTSSTAEFVARARLPDDDGLVVVSVAERNRYRHPSPEVLDRWRNNGRELHLTSEDGALWFRSDGSRLEKVHWRRVAHIRTVPVVQ